MTHLRLAGLVLIGTSAGAEDMVRKVQIGSLAKLIDLTGPPRFLPAEAAMKTFSPEFRRTQKAEVRRWESVVRAMPPRALCQALRAVERRRDLLDEIHRVTVPVTIVAGGRDRVVRPRHSERIQRRIPGSRLVILPRVGHAVPAERPEQTARILEALLPLRA